MSLYVRDAPDPLSPDEVSLWVQQAFITTCLNVMLTTLVVYDAVCTMDKEVKYFWNRDFSTMRLVYFLNRYGGIFGAILNCAWYSYNLSFTEYVSSYFTTVTGLANTLAGNLAQWGSYFSYAITIIAIDYVLTLRVLALYQKDKRLSILLYTLLIAEGSAKLIFVTLAVVAQGTALVGLGADTTACNQDGIAGLYVYMLDWGIPIAYGAFLLCLALFKAFKHWRRQGVRGSLLVYVLVKDQVLYFLVAMIGSAFIIVSDANDEEVSPTFTFVLTTLGSPTILCFLGSRMFFNLKEAGEHAVNIGTNWSSYQYSSVPPTSIQFDGSRYGEDISGLSTSESNDSERGDVIELSGNVSRSQKAKPNKFNFNDSAVTTRSIAFQEKTQSDGI